MSTTQVPFVKTVMPGSWNDEPMSSLVDVHSRGVDFAWLQKRAAAGVFKDLELQPEKGAAFIHLIAMADDELYGANRNGDSFLKAGKLIHAVEPHDGKTTSLRINCGNVDRHQTFEKYAKVYLHHRNKDPKKSHGDVVKSAHNEALGRVELIIKVPLNEVWEKDVEKMASGELGPPFSMSCRVPFDVCSYCLHKAASRKDYCDHLKHQMTLLTKEGHQIRAINDYMTNFDISRVTVPAERIAYGLLKAAGVGGVVSGAELSEGMVFFPPEADDPYQLFGGISSKLAAARKLAEMEKEIETAGSESSYFGSLARGLPGHALPESAHARLETQARSSFPDILGAMADAKIALCLPDFMRITLGKQAASKLAHLVPAAQEKLAGAFTRVLSNPDALSEFSLGSGVVSGNVYRLIEEITPGFALSEKAAHRRVVLSVVSGAAAPRVKSAAAVSETEKDVATAIADVYARYKVAAYERATAGNENKPLTALTVLGHYAQH